jgi:hypothetical protein
MAWTNWQFYKNSYRKGEEPVIPEQSFERWELQAVTALNRRNIRFNDVNTVEFLKHTQEMLQELKEDGTSYEAAPLVIQMLVCEYAEAMYIYAQNTNDKMGLQSESNFGYSWSRAGSKDEAHTAYLRHLNSIIAKWVGQTTWRDYFYGIGKMVVGF